MEKIGTNYGTIHQHTNIFLLPGEGFTGLLNWSEKLLSLAEAIPGKAEAIQPLIQLLVATIAPAKIYMLKQDETARNDSATIIDLLIVISGKQGVAFTELEPILNIACLQYPQVVCSLHHEGSVLEGLRKGHIFYSFHCTMDNLVYDNKVLDYPVTSPEHLLPVKQNALQIFNGNFRKAQEFYSSAESLYQKNFSPLVVFMLHQAAELTYRAILQSLNGYDKKSHEIRVLAKCVRPRARKLHSILNADTPEDKHTIELLDRAYLSARYDEQYNIAEKDLETIFKKVKLLQEVAMQTVMDTLQIK